MKSRARRRDMSNVNLEGLEARVGELEDRMAAKDVEFAVINTKLSAILWGVGITATAVVGVLVKMLFGL
jgi:hypothetical protein